MKYEVVAIVMIGLVVICAGKRFELTPAQDEEVRSASEVCGIFRKETKSGNCFGKCFLENLGFLIEDVPQENVIKAKIAPIIGEEEIVKIMKECNGLRAEDSCQTAIVLYDCYVQKVSELEKTLKD